jgi:acetyltransferase-like isoleucine patch superfamily enzyme
MSNDSLTTATARLLSRAVSKAESFWLHLLVQTQGVSGAVRYLRNPNPDYSADLLRSFGAEVGNGTTIKRSLQLDNISRDKNSVGDFQHLSIGRNCYVGDGVYFDLANKVVLGNDAILSGHVSIVTHADCNRSAFLADRFPRKCAPVHVKEGSWIGFGSTLLAGATVGPNSFVAAESLVTEDVESGSLYAGAPAEKVRSI